MPGTSRGYGPPACLNNAGHACALPSPRHGAVPTLNPRTGKAFDGPCRAQGIRRQGHASLEIPAPEIEGGRRGQKRSERILAQMAGLPGGYWVPGPGVKLDAYGNARGSTITQIQAVLRHAGRQPNGRSSFSESREFSVRMELARLMSVEMISSVVSGRRYRPKRLIPIAEKEPRRVTCEASCFKSEPLPANL